jgi:hypothetical protein
MKKLLLIVLPAIWIASVANGKDGLNSDDDQIIRKNLSQRNFKIDTTADAIILNESASVTFTYSERDPFHEFKVERTARIINEQGLDVAKVEFKLRHNQHITNVSAETFNLVNGRKLTKTESDKPITISDYGDNEKIARLNFSAVKPGSIIRYSYIIKTREDYRFPVWKFHNKYPILHSEISLITDIGTSMATISSQNTNFVQVDKETELTGCENCMYRANVNEQNLVYRSSTWAKNNIPADNYAPYVYAAGNSGDEIRFQLLSLQNLKVLGHSSNILMRTQEFLKDLKLDNWQEVNDELLYGDPRLGSQVFSASGYLTDLVRTLTAPAKDELSKARLIFGFVRDSIKLQDAIYSIYAASKLKNVLEERKGTIADKNLLLVAMLRKAGLKAEPVVLSTAENGQLRADFPLYAALNYVVAGVHIGDQELFLDASGPFMPFGLLKQECYNGLAFAVNKKGRFVTLSSDILFKDVTMVELEPREDQVSFSMEMINRLGLRSSMELRNKLFSKDSTKVIAAIQEQFSELPYKISERTVSFRNKANPDSLLTIIVAADVVLDSNSNLTEVSFMPYLVKSLQSNLKRGLYLDRQQSQTYLLTFRLPASYKPIALPQARNIVFGDNLLTYKSKISYDSGAQMLQANYVFTNKAADMSVMDMAELDSFVEMIKKNQDEPLILHSPAQ